MKAGNPKTKICAIGSANSPKLFFKKTVVKKANVSKTIGRNEKFISKNLCPCLLVGTSEQGNTKFWYSKNAIKSEIKYAEIKLPFDPKPRKLNKIILIEKLEKAPMQPAKINLIN